MDASTSDDHADDCALQLSDTATGVRLPLLRPAFFVANASLYLSFLLVLVLSATILSTLQVLQALLTILGV
jgi:hypothetical protein